MSAGVKAAEAAENDRQRRSSTAAHLALPNVIEGAPPGGEQDFLVIKHVGEPPVLDFEPRDHLELGEGCGAIDMERGAKVSGARFYFLRGVGAQLQWAMLNLAVNKAIANGFIPMIPPVLVKPESMEGTGFLGEHADEVYRLGADDLFLVGTSEVPLAAYHANEILDLANGSHPVRGLVDLLPPGGRLLRQGHQGHHPGAPVRQGRDVLLLPAGGRRGRAPAAARASRRRCSAEMEIPYRVIDVAAGDLGSSAARKFDCEAWVPTQQAYRELTSTSNCTTFQARRLGVRYRDEDGKPQVAATLNGTLATTRWLVAILENHQQAGRFGAGARRRCSPGSAAARCSNRSADQCEVRFYPGRVRPANG